MNNIIRSYAIDKQRQQIIPMLIGHKILSVGESNAASPFSEITLWAEVDMDEKTHDNYQITIHGQGEILTEDRGEFIGTVLTDDGLFVWHVYIRQIPNDS